ncbi:MAG: nucleotide exchange factor GrpE [Thermodesulfobacteriota bacterium]
MPVGDDNDMDKDLNSQDENIQNEDSSDNSEDLKSKYDDLYNRFIRLAADFDNYKKRISKEKQDISEYGNEELIRELLTVLDNLQLAIDHYDPDSDQNSLIEGVKLVLSQLANILQKFGLNHIDSEKGTEFDPRSHQAVERIETSEITPGLILDELVRGYLLNERLLRPASVTVSTNIIKQKINSINDEEAIENTDSTNENEEFDDNSENGERVFDLTDEDSDK